MEKCDIKKRPVPHQRLNIQLIHSAFNALEKNNYKIPLRIVLHFEVDFTRPLHHSIYLIGYFEKDLGDKKEYIRIDDKAFELLDEYAWLDMPLGLGNIYITSELMNKWFKDGKPVDLTPITYPNPHLAYQAGSDQLFPSPPASV
jgi:hypothetical protein